jgi:uncharacterized protein (TIGR02300 family)
VAKPELGTKRVCPETGRKFYDLNKDPVISPYTGKVVPVELPTARSRPDQAASGAGSGCMAQILTHALTRAAAPGHADVRCDR